MEPKRAVVLIGVGAVLFALVLSANAVVALDRTAFDADHAKESAHDAELYGSFAEEFRSEIAAGPNGDVDDTPLDRSESELLGAAVTDEYVRSQLERNIDGVYDFLNGRTDELRIAFDTEPVKERVLAEVEADAEELDLAAVEMPFGEEIEAMAADPDTFDERRATFREEQKARIQAETERDLSDEELAARLDASMDEIRAEMLAEMDAELEGQFDGPEAPLEAPVRELQTARIDALTGEVTHAEYASRVDEAEEELAEAFVATFEAELEENLPETVDSTEELGEEEMEMLETARVAVSLSGPVAVGLTVLAIAVAGLLGWVAPRSTAATATGASTAAAGAVGIVVSMVAINRIRSLLQGSGEAPAVEEFLLTFVTGVFDAVLWQSAVLLFLGGTLVAVGVAIRYDYL
ncbi:hypothetical protein JCM18237_21900 [Halorubrum luteum]